jgi:urea transporter/murein DD-endopeptidase MepM/ murein hydrolase activator NlpD
MQKAEKDMILFFDGLLFSYSQVFFSKNKVFALILMAVSFFDWMAGLSGLLAVMVSNLAAQIIGFRKTNISQGFYGFNSLLVGLGLGIYYEPGFAFFFVLIFAALFTLFISVWLEGFLWKYGLPYLSVPFLFGLWMVSLASQQFSELEMSRRGIFMLNEMYGLGGINLVNIYNLANEIAMPLALKLFFKSLAAIFFQYHLFAGVLVAIGLLIYSRIAFLLALTGFLSAYAYYTLIGANISELTYSYIGFNYILTAIAIGGFYIVPSRYSFLWVLLLTPVISFVITSAAVFLGLFGLAIYSTAFNVVVLMFLYVMKFRERNYDKPEPVVVQHFSPERNLYSQHNYQSRFDVNAPVELSLPILGEWTISQAHNGEHTHREDWRHAWDFEILDEEGRNYENSGKQLGDFYCYGKPLVAPADGWVQEISDGIPDNAVGDMNLGNNWGNTIVIMHTAKIYTKLSHLKPGTIKTYKGAFVKKGEALAQCGNSGRSAVPHLHFQVQRDPFIGSKTLDYPIAAYMIKTDIGYNLKTFDRPLKDQTVSNPSKSDSLHKAFNFVPGQKISFTYLITGKEERIIHWEVMADMYNNTYLQCSETASKAWFRNTGTLFYFTHFEGQKYSLLHYFYLAHYKLVLGYYGHLRIQDDFPPDVFKRGLLQFFIDFVSPFLQPLKSSYKLDYLSMEDNLVSSRISLRSEASLAFRRKILQQYDFETTVQGGRIERLVIIGMDVKITATEIRS